MVNFGLLWFVAYLAIMTLVVAMYRIYLKASLESAQPPLFGLGFLVGSDRLPSPIVDHLAQSMRAALCLATATSE